MSNNRPRTKNKTMKKFKCLAAAAVAGAALMSSVILYPIAAAATPNTPPEDYKKVLNITATAYAPGPHDNDQWGSKTYIGTQIRPGIIAVDPKVIPLGSKVYIEYPDGHGVYAVAEDTGGAIKGHRIDVAKWTVPEAYDYGIQHVKVYVVSSPEKNA